MGSELPKNQKKLLRRLHEKYPKYEYKVEDFKQDESIPTKYGSFGIVNFGSLKETDRTVACKKIYKTADYTKEIWREMETMIFLENNPFCLDLIGYYIDHNILTMITPMMRRGTLEANIKSINGTQQTLIAAGIAYGLMGLHKIGKLHLDLKPDNILLDDVFSPVIADFGSTKNEATREISVKNTPLYAPPELVCLTDSSHAKPTKEADVYSYGLILNSMMTKMRPYEDVNFFNYQLFIKYKEENVLPKIAENTPKRLKSLIRKCLRTEPEQRPSFEEIFKKFQSHEAYFPGTDFDEFDSLLQSRLNETSPKQLEDFVRIKKDRVVTSGTQEEIDEFVANMDIKNANDVMGVIENILYENKSTKYKMRIKNEQFGFICGLISTIYGKGISYAKLCKKTRIHIYLNFESEEYDSAALNVALYSAILNTKKYVKRLHLVVIPDSLIQRYPERVISFYSFILKAVIERINAGITSDIFDTFIAQFLQRYPLFGPQCAECYFRIAFYIIQSKKDEKVIKILSDTVKGILENKRVPSEQMAVIAAYRFVSLCVNDGIYEIKREVLIQDLKRNEYKNEVINYLAAKKCSDFDPEVANLLIDQSIKSASENFTPSVLVLLRLACKGIYDEYMIEKGVFKNLSYMASENPKIPIRLVLVFLGKKNSKLSEKVLKSPGTVNIIASAIDWAFSDKTLIPIIKSILKSIKLIREWSADMVTMYGNASFFLKLSRLSLCLMSENDEELLELESMIVLNSVRNGYIVADMVNVVPLVIKMLEMSAKKVKALNILNAMLDNEDQDISELLISSMKVNNIVEKLQRMNKNEQIRKLSDEVISRIGTD